MTARKADKEEKKKAMEEFRRQEGFIPYFSDTFFEETKNFHNVFFKWIVLAICLIELGLTLSDIWNIVWIYMITACLIPVYIKLRSMVEDRMKRFGYQMENDALIRMAWGKREVIPYTDIQRALMTEPVKMTVKEIKVPSLHGYISFPYEVGNAKQQQHVMACYDTLRNKVQYEMPMMGKENISYFDRMYTYNTNFRNCCFWLCFAGFLVFGSAAIQAEGTFDLIASLLPVGIQCGFLASMAKSIRLGMKNAKELQERLAQYPRTTYEIKYHKTWHLILVAMIVIAFNFLIVWYYWMR